MDHHHFYLTMLHFKQQERQLQERIERRWRGQQTAVVHPRKSKGLLRKVVDVIDHYGPHASPDVV